MVSGCCRYNNQNRDFFIKKAKMLKEFIESGLPCFPILDKNTPVVKHGEYVDRLPDIDEFKKFYGNNIYGIALKTGNKQTNIECIDFDLKNDDTESVWTNFTNEIGISHLYLESTPSGGYHLIYKSQETVGASEKLAYPKTGDKATIETRGQGGYVAIDPTKGYKKIHGDLKKLPILTKDEIDELKCVCRSFNLQYKRGKKKEHTTNTQRIYNSKYYQITLEFLKSEGWTINREHDDKYWLIRPGKTKGTSATLYKDSGYLYVFTASTEFDPETTYSPFYFLKKQTELSTYEAEKKVCEIIGDPFIKELLKEILRNTDKLKEIDVVDKLTNTIIDDMEKNGLFYNDGNVAYYFSNRELIVLDVKNNILPNFIYQKYDLLKTQTKINNIFEKCIRHALTKGEKTDVHYYSHWNEGSIYIDNFDGSIFKITEKDILQFDNGTDGVLFLKSDNVPLKDESNDVSLDILFDGLSFDEESLMENEQKTLFIYWFLSMFFLKDNKPILSIIGEKGTGKSDLLKNLLYLMYGNVNKILPVPDKEENFDNIITNNRFVVFDNADTGRTWLNDRLAICATGANIEMRELYTTNGTYNKKIDCFLALTSRTPKFTRDDVAERLLFIKLDKIKERKSDNYIVKRMIENRNSLMFCVFELIKRIIPLMKNLINNPVSRMGDFECFCRTVDKSTEPIFLKLIEEQKEFSEDTFTDIFREYFKEQTVFKSSFEKNAFELSREIEELSIKKGIKNLKLTSHSVAFKMKKDYDFCTISKVKESQGNKSHYEITKRESLL
jgi:hypothetical protein